MLSRWLKWITTSVVIDAQIGIYDCYSYRCVCNGGLYDVLGCYMFRGVFSLLVSSFGDTCFFFAPLMTKSLEQYHS